jgi:DNA-binding response OmpR family regulator
MPQILVIDDDRNFRHLVTVALRPAGHEILEAGSAREAESILARGRVDLLLVDGLLPDADGSQWISERRKTVGAPFIFVSAFWKAGRDARQLHADVKPAGFLRKPATAEQILGEVQKVFGSSPRCVLSGADLDDLEAMRIEYAASVPGRMAEIRLGVEQLRRRARDPVLFAETRRHVHEMAGTAGSFGFEPLSEICARLEQALLAWRSRGDELSWAAVGIEERALVRWEQQGRREESLPGSGPRAASGLA